MTYLKHKNVMCVGVGGGLVYYVALFLHLLGNKVIGFDQARNQRTEDLEKRGIKLTFSNPEIGTDYNVDLVIYTPSIQTDFLQDLKNGNKRALFMEVGEFTLKLLEDFDDQKLDTKEQSAFLESNIAPLYKVDCNELPFVGVTGTDGKTTTCEMLYHILMKAGFHPAVVTTVSAKCGNVEVDTGFHTTTPSAQELYALIEKLRGLGCSHIILEVTSHALAMGRVAGLKFDVVVFTNVTQDHLDYHKTWENYIHAKSLLITKNLKDGGTVVLDGDDIKARQYLSKLIAKEQTAITPVAHNIIVEGDLINFYTAGTLVVLNILGEYNIKNALGALWACLGLGLELQFPELCKHLASFKGVEGRMQVIQKEPFMAIVDFAHTPNALQKALMSARSLTRGELGRVVVVFGCAGNRDTIKRPLMGAVAKKYADITILTAEDPRTEDVTKINSQVEAGWDN